jgi:hypothetical protein
MKKSVSINLIVLVVCFVCVIGLSLSATYLVVHARFQSQLDDKDREVLTVQKDSKTLADQNAELRNSLQKLEDQYNKLDAHLSKIEAQQADSQAPEQNQEVFEDTPVLNPKWVNSGETALAFDGNLSIVLNKASERDECQKGATAVTYLTGDAYNQKLCLRTGKPETFTYQGKNYSFNLSGIAAQASVYRYCISISSER